MRKTLVLLVVTAMAMLGALAVPQTTPSADAQIVAEFTCTVDGDVLSWTDQGVLRYQVRQVIGDSETFLTSVVESTSLDLPGNADEYAVRYRDGLTVNEARCAGNPALPFTCSVAEGTLSWTDQGVPRYQIRQRIGDSETFLTSVVGATSLALPGNADAYVVRARINGVPTDTVCTGNPLPEFTCSVADDVLSWTDQEAARYIVRQATGDNETFLASVTDGTSLALTGNADTYIVKTRVNGVAIFASCAGNPLPAFTCSVAFDGEVLRLTWSDQEQDRYQVRQLVDDVDSFVTSVEGATDLVVDGSADQYTVRYRNNGVVTQTSCPGVPIAL